MNDRPPRYFGMFSTICGSGEDTVLAVAKDVCSTEARHPGQGRVLRT